MPGGLDDHPYTHQVTKDQRVLVSYRGRQVTVVAGTPARRLISALDSADEDAVQHLLARATGQFKHGNERPASPKG